MTVSAQHAEVVARYARHVNPGFIKLLGMLGYGRVFVKGRGTSLWDDEGNVYLDFLAGYGSVNLGHNHPRVIERMQSMLAAEPVHFCHMGADPHAAELAETLAGAADPPLQRVLFATGGAEAVEAALKLSRAFTGRSRFLYCDGGYHGTSLGTLSVMGAQRLRAPFEPLLDGTRAIPFGDLDALRAALERRTYAGFLVESIQGEAGVILPPDGYLAAAQALCKRYGTLLLLDEVQTGFGRTGTTFAYQAEGFVPDVLILAKGLSGGMAATGATLTSEAIHDKAYGTTERFDLHSATFQGNALSCAAALGTLDVLADADLAANSARLGTYMIDTLRRRLAGHPLVRDIRGRGLLVGIELGPTGQRLVDKVAPGLVRLVSKQVFGHWLALKLLEAGIVAQPASHHHDVLKLEPPLTVSEPEVDRVVDAVGDILDEYRSVTSLLKDVSVRLGGQARRGWAF